VLLVLVAPVANGYATLILEKSVQAGLFPDGYLPLGYAIDGNYAYIYAVPSSSGGTDVWVAKFDLNSLRAWQYYVTNYENNAEFDYMRLRIWPSTLNYITMYAFAGDLIDVEGDYLFAPFKHSADGNLYYVYDMKNNVLTNVAVSVPIGYVVTDVRAYFDGNYYYTTVCYTNTDRTVNDASCIFRKMDAQFNVIYEGTHPAPINPSNSTSLQYSTGYHSGFVDIIEHNGTVYSVLVQANLFEGTFPLTWKDTMYMYYFDANGVIQSKLVYDVYGAGNPDNPPTPEVARGWAVGDDVYVVYVGGYSTSQPNRTAVFRYDINANTRVLEFNLTNARPQNEKMVNFDGTYLITAGANRIVLWYPDNTNLLYDVNFERNTSIMMFDGKKVYLLAYNEANGVADAYAFFIGYDVNVIITPLPSDVNLSFDVEINGNTTPVNNVEITVYNSVGDVVFSYPIVEITNLPYKNTFTIASTPEYPDGLPDDVYTVAVTIEGVEYNRVKVVKGAGFTVFDVNGYVVEEANNIKHVVFEVNGFGVLPAGYYTMRVVKNGQVLNTISHAETALPTVFSVYLDGALYGYGDMTVDLVETNTGVTVLSIPVTLVADYTITGVSASVIETNADVKTVVFDIAGNGTIPDGEVTVQVAKSGQVLFSNTLTGEITLPATISVTVDTDTYGTGVLDVSLIVAHETLSSIQVELGVSGGEYVPPEVNAPAPGYTPPSDYSGLSTLIFIALIVVFGAVIGLEAGVNPLTSSGAMLFLLALFGALDMGIGIAGLVLAVIPYLINREV